jgi:hypothetical protein
MSEATDAWEAWQNAPCPSHGDTVDCPVASPPDDGAGPSCGYFAILDATPDFSVGPDPLAGRGDAGIAVSGTGAEDPS